MGSNQKKSLELPGTRLGYIKLLKEQPNVSLITKYSRFLSDSKKSSSSYNISKMDNENGSNTSFNIYEKFNSLILTFQFAPPSDNIWNIEIHLSDLHYTTGTDVTEKNLNQLYENIKTVNESWNKGKAVSTWNIKAPYADSQYELTHGDEMNNYLSAFNQNCLGMFLAQTVNFTPFSINYDGASFGELQQFGSFYKNAKVVKSRKDDDTLKIGFLVSNWDIGDILIEPWMAAIAQHGLIERDNICIKAKIIITEYSISRPKENKNGSSLKTEPIKMEARKQYIFNNCFPISRDDIKKSYDQTEAGTYKTQVVTFIYDTYQLNYLF